MFESGVRELCLRVQTSISAIDGGRGDRAPFSELVDFNVDSPNSQILRPWHGDASVRSYNSGINCRIIPEMVWTSEGRLPLRRLINVINIYNVDVICNLFIFVNVVVKDLR
jgi:hypothetical protein